jgi:hypothetical protein
MITPSPPATTAHDEFKGIPSDAFFFARTGGN